MKLLRVDVEHFACIRRASVELGPGMNVLFGPNDLGKSTLARAIRAALLVQHSSSVANDFVEWDTDESPSVKLTLELPDRRIWRVEKRFGSTGSSILRTSTDGKTFSPYKKAREVDDEIRTKLCWGIASPATKGAPRGLPTSFLATVLLGEQTDVAGVLRQTLEADSDESGRERLTTALAAFAQDPLFKSILEEAQAKVDIAFTTKGTKKRGSTSPFREVTDAVKRVKGELDQVTKRVDDSENARRELEACNEELLRRQEALNQAVETRDALRVAKAHLEARREVEEELAAARKRLEDQESEVAALEDRSTQLAEMKSLLEGAKESQQSLASEKEVLLAKEKSTEEALRRASSAEAGQARQLRRGELERRGLELDSKSKEIAAVQEKAAKARGHQGDLEKSKSQAAELEAIRAQSDETADAAEAAKREAEHQLELVEVASLMSHQRRLRSSIEELEKQRDEIADDRARAGEHRTRAREHIGSVAPDLPEAATLESMQALAHDLEVSEAKLGGGLAVVVERLQAVALEGTADGSIVDLPAIGTVSFEATRGFVVQIGDVAKVSVAAGEREAREHAATLRRRWDSEVAPVLAHLGASDLSTLLARAAEATARRKQAEAAESAAAALEERVALRSEQLTKLDEHQEELAAIGRELEGKASEAAAKLLEDLGEKPLDKHRADLKQQQSEAQTVLDSARAQVRAADTESQVLAERMGAAEKAMAGLGIAEPESGWDAFEAQLAERAAQLHGEQEEVSAEIASLAAVQDAEVKQEEVTLEAVREDLTRVESKIAESIERLDSLRDKASRLEGEIESRRDAVAKLDVPTVKKEVDEIAARLAALPSPLRAFTADEMRDSEQRLKEAEQAHERAKDDVRKAEGALQTVGGRVVIEQQGAATDALRQAEQKEREVELEFDAWRLLVEKLREAENTEGQHLGEALSQPVTESFARLTAGRYGKLEVAPNLRTEGLRVAGVLREVSALSAGTQEQLATLLRITVAEQLGNTLVLDDQLTQTDPARSVWFRDLLREHAAQTQVIVLTCRPLDYLLEEDLPAEGDITAVRAAGVVRAIDLSRVIVRSEGATPTSEQVGAE